MKMLEAMTGRVVVSDWPDKEYDYCNTNYILLGLVIRHWLAR
jgi:hypothetical protein